MKKAALFLGIICIFVFIGCGQEEKGEQAAPEKPKEAVETAKEKSESTVDKAAKEKTKETKTTAEEKTGKAAEDVKEKAGQAAETVKKEAEEAAETVKQKTGEAVKSAEDKIRRAKKAGVPGVIEMKNEKMFSQHRMGIISFDHRAHVDEYDLGCGKCHHDENNQPLNDLSYDDPVKGCAQCHDKEGRPRRQESMSDQQWKKEQLKYYYGAIHENCTGCHKETKGPVKCMQCHPAPEKKSG
ncbi:MAG: hypothetical protein KGY38_05960 [Desulfobacterales bacterium]|nr:hypothetical protein [Desulfobacterales bacterium]